MTILFLLILASVPAAFDATERRGIKDMVVGSRLVVDFADPRIETWRTVNDDVMGGISQSRLHATENGTALFTGFVSLENNGGFASARTSVGEVDLTDYDGLAVRVRGDGKSYRVRLRTDDRFDGIAYQASFETGDESWQVVEIPFANFKPTYRGRTARGAPLLNIANISQVGFMIADKQKGTFRLEIAWIRAYKTAASDEAYR